MVRLTDRPKMTIDVYHRHKTTTILFMFSGAFNFYKVSGKCHGNLEANSSITL